MRAAFYALAIFGALAAGVLALSGMPAMAADEDIRAACLASGQDETACDCRADIAEDRFEEDQEARTAWLAYLGDEAAQAETERWVAEDMAGFGAAMRRVGEAEQAATACFRDLEDR